MFFYLLKGRWRDSRYSFIGKTDGSTGMGCSETRPQMAAKSAEIPLGPTADRRSLFGRLSEFLRPRGVTSHDPELGLGCSQFFFF